MRAIHWRYAVASVIGVALLGALGPASAYWPGSGDGAGSAATGTTGGITLTAGTGSADLHPGGVGRVVVIATNPNDFAVHFTSIDLDASAGSGGFSVDGAHASCGLATLSFTSQSNGGAGWSLGAGASSTITLASALAMGADAAQACVGATFTVHLVAIS